LARSIPFSTVKPGLAECNRVFTELFSLCIWTTADLGQAACDKAIKASSPSKSQPTNVKLLDLNFLKTEEIANITQEDIIDINKTKKREYQEKKAKSKAGNETNGQSSEEEYVPFSSDFTKSCPRPSISVEGNIALTKALDQLLPEKKLINQLKRERRLSENAEEQKEADQKLRSLSRSGSQNRHSRSRTTSRSESTPGDDVSVYKICCNGSPQELEDFSKIIPAEIWKDQSLDANGRAPLHISTRSGNLKILNVLLRTYNANPEVTDKTNQTPYEAARDKTVRNVFRVFRHDFPDKWDYKAAKIDDPISQEELDSKKISKNQKKSKAKSKKTEAKKEQKKVEEQKKFEEHVKRKEAERIQMMSPRELMIEKRLAAIAKRQAEGLS